MSSLIDEKRRKSLLLLLYYIIFIVVLSEIIYYVAKDTGLSAPRFDLVITDGGYADGGISSVFGKLIFRIKEQPFNLIATLIFFCAIIHTFLSHKFAVISHALVKKEGKESFASEIFHFLSEVEVIFGIWVIPLIACMTIYYDWSTSLNYLNTRDYTEPTFVIVIMALAATKPVFKIAEDVVKYIASLGGSTPRAWWLTILTLGPFLGSFITEPGAMTISALLLSNQFYRLNPSVKLKYATLGLLFTNISVGGVFTNFAAPPVLMVSKAWHWDTYHMAMDFGWRAMIGIIVSNVVYYLYFRKEFDTLGEVVVEKKEEEESIPLWISITHLGFLAWCVVHSHYPVVFIGSFLIFLGFYQATRPFQYVLNLKTPVMVGFFLAGLVVHGGLQAWWIAPILSNVSEGVLMVSAIILTAFNDNAEITYLATLVPGFAESMKYMVVAGAVTGGGLTVIANAPNPAGQAILGRFYPDGIAPLSLFYAALTPTVIVGLCFYLLG